MTTQNNSRGLCFECNEGIFNPICPSCLTNEIKAWVEGNGFDAKTASQISAFARKTGNQFLDSGTDCAICNENQTSICPYCFTERVYNFLNRINAGRKILEEFLTHFNYDADHKGYSREFEEDFE